MLDPKKYQSFSLIKDFVSEGIFVEIGCHKYEGSTIFINEVAKYKNTVLYTVDVDNNALRSIADTDNLIKINKKGEDWLQNDLPNLKQKISVLFLDNFDWFWNNTYPDWTLENCSNQAKWYKDEFNLEMNNMNSQKTHLLQGILSLPHMSDNSFIFIDDTWLTIDGVYSGKGGAVIPFLLLNGYEIVYNWGHMPILTNNINEIEKIKKVLNDEW